MHLPIDAALPEIVARAGEHRGLVIVAEPGAGKTTRVPPALLDAGWGQRGEIVVLEPRRIAARMAASFVAAERGEPVGATIGYQVRFDDRTSAATRVRYVTEGILTRRLARDRRLDGVAAVVLDEFHERSLDADVALALLERLRRDARPDLALIVMSATLDAEPLADFLGVPVQRVPGRAFPVAIEYVTRPDPRPLEQRVRSAVHALPDEGDVLVFLPGAAEIRRCAEALGGIDALVLPLHGDLPAAEQDRAVRPAAARKIVLATNVAETSITIDGVTAVIDSGLFRRAGHSPWSGLPTLDTLPVSQASAAQRAGRAGRTAPGRAVRLYTRHDHDTRPAFESPGILRSDLAGVALLLAVLYPGELAPLAWLSPPPATAWDAAHELLGRLGAIDRTGAATATGRAMLDLPLAPRAARLLLAAAEAGDPARGATAAALLGERDLRRSARVAFDGRVARAAGHGGSDLLVQLELFEDAASRRHDLEPAAVQRVIRARAQLGDRLPRPHPAVPQGSDAALLRAILLAFPDRVARRRAPGSDAYVFAGGGSGTLAPGSVAHGAEYVVAVEAEEQRGRGVVIRSASVIEPDWLLDLLPERIADDELVRFDAEAERVEVISRMAYDGLALVETRRTDATGPDVSRVLFEAARAAGPAAWCDPERLERWQARLRYAAGVMPDWPVHDDAAVLAMLERLCEGRRSMRELRDADLLGALAADLGHERRAALDRVAPEALQLPGGRRITVHYEAGKPPWAGSYLQDFFGLREAPRVGHGEPLVLHLWAPSRRPVQITTDLVGFWTRHYPALRQELMRRYPRHAWPEDPLSARPPQRRDSRSR